MSNCIRGDCAHCTLPDCKPRFTPYQYATTIMTEWERGKGVSEIAEKVGCGRATVYRWLHRKLSN